MIQTRVTEVPGQMRQTHFQSVTTNLSTFHNMHFDHQPGKWLDASGDRISNLTSTKMFILCFELARFIYLFIFFAFATREAKCKQRNFMCYLMKIETSLEKKNFFEANPPPLRKFLGLWPPHPPGISNPFHGGEYIFSGTTHSALPNIKKKKSVMCNFFKP